MSTVVLDTITGKSTATTKTIGSTPEVSARANSMTIRGEGSAQTSIQQGLCKCWVNINADGAGTADSFNLTSITDTNTGRYGVVIANNMANANYTTAGHSGGGNARIMLCDNDRTTTLANIAVYTKGDTNTYADDITFCQVHGDLA